MLVLTISLLCFQRIILLYSMWYLSLAFGENIKSIITGNQLLFFLNVILLLILYYEYDFNTVHHKNFVKIHSLVYRVGYCGAIILLFLCYQCMNHYSDVKVAQSCSWTVACQAPLSMEFSRQEYWSG